MPSLTQLWLIADSGPAHLFDLQMVVTENHDLGADVTEHAVERGSDIADHIVAKPVRVTMELFLSNQPLEHEKMRQASLPIEVAAPQGPVGGLGPIALPDYPKPTLLSLGGITRAVTDLVGGLLNGPVSYNATVGDKAGTAALASPKTYHATVGVFDSEFDAVQEAHAFFSTLRASGALLQLFTPKAAYTDMVLENFGMSRGPRDGDGATMSVSFKQIRIVDTRKVAAPENVTIALKALDEANKGAQGAQPKQSILAKGAQKLGIKGASKARALTP